MPTSSTFAPGTLGHEAHAYASRGYLIFPLWHCTNGVCACDDGAACGSPGKHPRTHRGLTDAASDPGIVDRWWAMWPEANIGMPAGGNGLAVIDVDPRHRGGDTITVLEQYCAQHGVDLFATRHIRTGSGGDHLIYWQPPGGIVSKSKAFGPDAPGVDTRGKGGYIVAPPSVHATGRRYEVIGNGHTIAPWPDCLTRLLQPSPAGPAGAEETGLPAGVIACGPRPLTGGDRGAVWAFHALLSETKQLEDLPLAEGNGKNLALNNAAYKLGRRVGAGYLTEADVAGALYAVASRWPGHTERELRATIRSGLRAGIANPHPGPATRGGAS